MAASEKVTIHKPLDETLPAAARALQEAGFAEVRTDEASETITAKKSQRFQWSKGEVSVVLSEQGSDTEAEVISSSSAQSPPSLVASPAKRIVDDVVEVLSGL